MNALKEGLFDVGMIGMRVEDDQIEFTPFCRDQMVLITPVNDHFLELKRQGATIRELLREPVMMRETGSGSKKTADRFLESIGISEDSLNIVARINDQEAIKNMVSGGLGISIISRMAAKNILAEKRVLSFPLDDHFSGRSIYLIFRKDCILAPHIQSFLEFMLKKSKKGVPL